MPFEPDEWEDGNPRYSVNADRMRKLGTQYDEVAADADDPGTPVGAAVSRAVIPGVQEVAPSVVQAELQARSIPQVTGAGAGGLQVRFPANGSLGWMSDTSAVDSQTGTTLPDTPTVAALRRVGFPVTTQASDVGVGAGLRAEDGRNTALEVADTYDHITGIVPLTLRAQIAVGIVTKHHSITGVALAALVPAGRYVLHEQSDGFHLILGEKTNA